MDFKDNRAADKIMESIAEGIQNGDFEDMLRRESTKELLLAGASAVLLLGIAFLGVKSLLEGSSHDGGSVL